eukprot:1496834-Prymnesium_polylepis.1
MPSASRGLKINFSTEYAGHPLTRNSRCVGFQLSLVRTQTGNTRISTRSSSKQVACRCAERRGACKGGTLTHSTPERCTCETETVRGPHTQTVSFPVGGRSLVGKPEHELKAAVVAKERQNHAASAQSKFTSTASVWWHIYPERAKRVLLHVQGWLTSSVTYFS